VAKYRTLKPRPFSVEFRDWREASVHGGQLAVTARLDPFGLKARVARAPARAPRTPRGKGFDPLVYVTQLLHRFTSGGVSLADAERLNEDGPLLALLGIEQLPDQTAAGEWLRDLGAPGGQALRRINRDFVPWALRRAQPARARHLGRTECFFDDTQIEVSGPSFEGAAINYEGPRARSWPVLLVGPFLADHLLGATRDTKESPASDQAGKDVSNRRPELLKANAPLWNQAESYLDTDRASSAGKYLETIADHFGAWSVSYNQWTGPLETKATEFPELAWGRPRNGRAGATAASTRRGMRGFAIRPAAVQPRSALRWCATDRTGRCSGVTPFSPRTNRTGRPNWPSSATG
jgi:hypothetical protein